MKTEKSKDMDKLVGRLTENDLAPPEINEFTRLNDFPIEMLTCLEVALKRLIQQLDSGSPHLEPAFLWLTLIHKSPQDSIETYLKKQLWKTK